MLFIYGIKPNMNLIWFPVISLIMMLFSASIGLWMSALAIQYRDIKHAMQFFVQIMMYSAPVVWPISLLGEKLGDSFIFWYGFYPMVGVIESFRAMFIAQSPMPWDLIFQGIFSSIVMFYFGLMYFNGREKVFADIA